MAPLYVPVAVGGSSPHTHAESDITGLPTDLQAATAWVASQGGTQDSTSDNESDPATTTYQLPAEGMWLVTIGCADPNREWSVIGTWLATWMTTTYMGPPDVTAAAVNLGGVVPSFRENGPSAGSLTLPAPSASGLLTPSCTFPDGFDQLPGINWQIRAVSLLSG